MTIFGEFLKECRIKAGLSQRALAEIVGLHFTYINKIEKEAISPPSEEKLLLIEEALGIEKYDLVLYAEKVPSDFKHIILIDQNVQDYLRERVKAWETMGHIADGMKYFMEREE